jgi:hypothetical protein
MSCTPNETSTAAALSSGRGANLVARALIRDSSRWWLATKPAHSTPKMITTYSSGTAGL